MSPTQLDSATNPAVATDSKASQATSNYNGSFAAEVGKHEPRAPPVRRSRRAGPRPALRALPFVCPSLPQEPEFAGLGLR
jgi:hypothetical protein